MHQVSVLAGAQDIQMDNTVIIAANTVSEDVHIKVHANVHRQVNFNERMEQSKVSYVD